MESQNGWCRKWPLEVMWSSCTSWTNNRKGRSFIKLNKLLVFLKTWKTGAPTRSIISCPTSPSSLKQDTTLARAKNQLLSFVAVEKCALTAETWEGGGILGCRADFQLIRDLEQSIFILVLFLLPAMARLWEQSAKITQENPGSDSWITFYCLRFLQFKTNKLSSFNIVFRA